MKYVLKEDKSNASYIVYHLPGSAFSFNYTLDHATKFNSISEVLDAVQARTRENPTFVLPSLTIVGIKEVTVPQYEEVEL